MRTILLACLLLLPFAAVAEESVSVETGTDLTTILISVALTLLAAGIGWVVARFGLRQKEPENLSPIDLTTSEGRRRFLDERLVPTIVSTGKHWLLTQVPRLIASALNPDDRIDWSDLLSSLRTYVLVRVQAKFQKEGVNLAEYLGDSQELDDLVDRQIMQLITRLPDAVGQLIPAEQVDRLTDQLRQFLAREGANLLTRDPSAGQ